MTPILLLSLLAYVAALLHAPASVPLDAIAAHASGELEAVEVLVWMEHESDFGRALGGKRWDARAYGILQVRDEPWLEHDAAASVEAWLRRKRGAAKMCGDDGLAAISSGRCDRGTKLAESRRQEAEALWILASYELGRP